MSTTPEAMPCPRPVLVMLLSDGGMLSYTAFRSPIGVRFSKLRLDSVGNSDGRGPHGVSSRITRFDGLGEGKLIYRSTIWVPSCNALAMKIENRLK